MNAIARRRSRARMRTADATLMLKLSASEKGRALFIQVPS
jgi:hypothetical protein